MIKKLENDHYQIHPDDSGNRLSLELEHHGIQQVDLDRGNNGVHINTKSLPSTKIMQSNPTLTDK